MIKKIKNKRTLVIALLLLCALTLALSIGVTYAKYRLTEDDDTLLPSSNFYFESNLLKEGGANYELNINYIRFDLRTFADDMRQSEVAVEYTLSLKRLKNGEGDADEVIDIESLYEMPGSTIPAGATDYETIIFDNLDFGMTYEVTATAVSPYTKTISATFTLLDSENSLSYELREDPNGFVVYMTLRTNDLGSTVKVYWNDAYVPDNSAGPLAAAVSNPAEGVVLKSNSVYEFKFYKTDLSVSFNEDIAKDFYVEISAPHTPEAGTDGSITDNDGDFDKHP